METALLFMEHLMGFHTVTKANEDMDYTVVENNSETFDYKPQLLSKHVVKPPFDMRSEMEGPLADLVT